MNEREHYRGPFADFAKKIVLPNTAKEVNNKELLQKATETHAVFYKETLALIASIPLEIRAE